MTVTVASLSLHGLPASASSNPSHVQTISVDTGFRVKRDGFSFANWSGLSKSTALSTKHMFQLLNEAWRCVDDGTNPKCTLRNAQSPDGRLVTLSGKGAGGLDYVPMSMRSTRSQWEFLGGF